MSQSLSRWHMFWKRCFCGLDCKQIFPLVRGDFKMQFMLTYSSVLVMKVIKKHLINSTSCPLLHLKKLVWYIHSFSLKQPSGLYEATYPQCTLHCHLDNIFLFLIILSRIDIVKPHKSLVCCKLSLSMSSVSPFLRCIGYRLIYFLFTGLIFFDYSQSSLLPAGLLFQLFVLPHLLCVFVLNRHKRKLTRPVFMHALVCLREAKYSGINKLEKQTIHPFLMQYSYSFYNQTGKGLRCTKARDPLNV